MASRLAPLTGAILLATTLARAEERPRANVGMAVTWLSEVSVSGGIGPYMAEAQSPTLGVRPYGEWQIKEPLALGLSVPLKINAPGVSSTANEVGIAPRVRVGFPLSDWFYPYWALELGPAWSRQPQKAWLLGVDASSNLGARLRLTRTLCAFSELSYEYTSFSGDLPLYYATSGTPAPTLHGSVRTSYLGIGAGFELRF